MIKSYCLALCLAAAIAPAQADTLDFGSGPTAPLLCTNENTGVGAMLSCNNGNFISQSYGDVAGVLDVQYDAPRYGGGRSLRWWNTSYNNLFGVLWADGSDGDSQAAIELRPLTGGTVSLAGFDLGAYSNTSRGTTLTVSELVTGNVLYSFSGSVGNVSTNLATHFALSNVSSANGLRIQWQDSAYNVGIDNIDYTITTVPEPGTWGLLAGGLVAVGAMARRRRAG